MPIGIVYVLTNESMLGYVKIGKTSENLEARIKQLDMTNTPLPFTCFYAAEVSDPDFVEKRLHEAFGDHRVRNNREFFRISPERVVSALRLSKGEDVTLRRDIVENVDDEKALNEARARRSKFSFDMVGIKPGMVLNSYFDAATICTVAADNRVLFEGRDMSLSASALEVAKRHGYNVTALSGPQYWMLDDKSLDELRREKEEENLAT